MKTLIIILLIFVATSFASGQDSLKANCGMDRIHEYTLAEKIEAKPDFSYLTVKDSVIWINPSDSIYINKSLTMSNKEFFKPKIDWLEGLENTALSLSGTVVFGIFDYVLYREVFMNKGNKDLYRYLIQPLLDITIGYALYKLSGDNIKVSIGYGLLRLGGWADEIFYNIHGLKHDKYGGNFNPTASHLWWTFPTGWVKKDITIQEHQFNLGITLSINYLLQTL